MIGFSRFPGRKLIRVKGWFFSRRLFAPDWIYEVTGVNRNTGLL